ncbi:hypothetical protein L4X63_17845 [Geomonas sp. Red32]|uniref:hypothetical protein n=1 Tax=Geomonas sp. Red32 TaxID=2912856 RepID=UPI00202CDF5D|nr:hypothetical protein [Geomonas sp. Red32]MCM0083451.1 hypothetical protein [Geomonas sp. Red32]
MTDGNKGKKSLMAQLFSTETVICIVGIGCVVYGLIDGFKVMQTFFGFCIILGSFALRLVRTKDWDAHWAEQQRVRQAHEARMAQEREEKK